MACVFFLFLLIKHKIFIVKMSTIKHLLVITLGCIFGFSSIIFDFRNPNLKSCITRDTTLSIGYILIYSILYLKIYYYILNNIPENITFSSSSLLKSSPDSKNGEGSLEVSKFDMSMDVRSGFNFVGTVNNNNNNNNTDLIKETLQSKKEVENIASSLFRKQYIEGLKKSFNRIFVFIYSIFLISFVLTLCIYLKTKLVESQMGDEQQSFATVCESLAFSPVQYAIHLLLLCVLLTNVKKLWALSGMFAEARHIW